MKVVPMCRHTRDQRSFAYPTCGVQPAVPEYSTSLMRLAHWSSCAAWPGTASPQCCTFVVSGHSAHPHDVSPRYGCSAGASCHYVL